MSGRRWWRRTGSLIVWEALGAVYDALGFTAVRDEAFEALVLGRIIEPTSKARHGPGAGRARGRLRPTRVTFMRCLKRVIERDYRGADLGRLLTRTRPARAGWRWCSMTSPRCTSRPPREDGLRKVGMSKERRVDPQVTVGLLTDRRRVPAGGAPVRGQQGRDQDR